MRQELDFSQKPREGRWLAHGHTADSGTVGHKSRPYSCPCHTALHTKGSYPGVSGRRLQRQSWDPPVGGREGQRGQPTFPSASADGPQSWSALPLPGCGSGCSKGTPALSFHSFFYPLPVSPWTQAGGESAAGRPLAPSVLCSHLPSVLVGRRVRLRAGRRMVFPGGDLTGSHSPSFPF